MFKFSALPNRWRRVTAPVLASAWMPPAYWTRWVLMARLTMPRIRPITLGRMAKSNRRRPGPDHHPVLHLTDRHRVPMCSRGPCRWLVKNLGGLLFSALDSVLTFRDYYRFPIVYAGPDWAQCLRRDYRFCREVFKRARKIYQRALNRPPDLHAPFRQID